MTAAVCDCRLFKIVGLVHCFVIMYVMPLYSKKNDVRIEFYSSSIEDILHCIILYCPPPPPPTTSPAPNYFSGKATRPSCVVRYTFIVYALHVC